MPPIPSGNLYPAMIQRTVASRDGNAYTEGIPAMAMGPEILIPTDGHLPLALGSILVLRAN